MFSKSHSSQVAEPKQDTDPLSTGVECEELCLQDAECKKVLSQSRGLCDEWQREWRQKRGQIYWGTMLKCRERALRGNGFSTAQNHWGKSNTYRFHQNLAGHSLIDANQPESTNKPPSSEEFCKTWNSGMLSTHHFLGSQTYCEVGKGNHIVLWFKGSGGQRTCLRTPD